MRQVVETLSVRVNKMCVHYCVSSPGRFLRVGPLNLKHIKHPQTLRHCSIGSLWQKHRVWVRALPRPESSPSGSYHSLEHRVPGRLPEAARRRHVRSRRVDVPACKAIHAPVSHERLEKKILRENM